MADAAKDKQDPKDAAKDAPAKGGKKTLLLMGGGGVGILAAAFVVATMAAPDKGKPELQGPFVAPLTTEKIQVNLSKSKSFLVLNLNLVYTAYDESYFAGRSSDSLCVAELKDVLVSIASSKTPAEFEDKVNKPVIMEEVRQAVEPILFPVHIGDTPKPTDRDPTSGLAPGLSSHLATFRGFFHEHTLAIDAKKRVLRLDDGAGVEFKGEERDLKIVAGDDTVLYVDVSGLTPEFVGEVCIGIRGQTRRILWQEVLIQ